MRMLTSLIVPPVLFTIPAVIVGVASGMWWISGLIWAIAAVIVIIRLGFVTRSWRSWGYVEREDDLYITHGVMFRNLIAVPYGRMQLVEVESGPLERAFGLASVTLEDSQPRDRRSHSWPYPGGGNAAAGPADRTRRSTRLGAMTSSQPPQHTSPVDPVGPEVTTPPHAPAAASPSPKPTERPHPLTPFVRGWLVFVAIAIGWGREIVTSAGENQFEPSGLAWLLPILGVVVLLAAVTGFISWYFTRFVIDDEELRIETGAIFKKSTKIPFERLQSVDIIQPLAARMFGLAELRLDAGNSTTKLRYLTRSKASRFRDYLLARAHGHQASIRDLDQQSVASVFTDLGVTDQPLVQVSPQRLIISFLLSTEWLIPAAMSIIILVVTSAFGVVPLALGALIPLVIGMLSLIWRRVIGMFNFTLAESSRGLRITRGLTNLTSQSVPINRIQGVKTSQPLLWRPMGWYRVDIDILGYSHGDSENNESTSTSVLLPVASLDEVELALGRALPGFDLDGVELHASPNRARWLRWFDFWTLRYGWDDRILITEQGWVTHVRDVVPHAKTQSVLIEQGPLQRALRTGRRTCPHATRACERGRTPARRARCT